MKFITIFFVLFALAGTVLAQDTAPTIPEDLTYISDDGTISFHYPLNWQMQRIGTGYFTLTSDPFILGRYEADIDTMFEGDVVLSLILVPTKNAERLYSIVGDNPTERLENLLTSPDLDPDLEFGAIETTEDGFPRTRTQKGEDAEITLIVWDIADDLFGVAVMISAPGHFEEAEAITNDILLSVEFSTTVDELEATQSGESQ